MNRRDFFKLIGIGAVGIALAPLVKYLPQKKIDKKDTINKDRIPIKELNNITGFCVFRDNLFASCGNILYQLNDDGETVTPVKSFAGEIIAVYADDTNFYVGARDNVECYEV